MAELTVTPKPAGAGTGVNGAQSATAPDQPKGPQKRKAVMQSAPHTVTLIPGDGIGPEVADATLKILAAAGANITWEKAIAGGQAVIQSKEALPAATIESVRRNKVALKGPTALPEDPKYRSANVQLRRDLDLGACIRPVKSVEGVKTRYENVDLVIFRENTEDLYAGLEKQESPGQAVAIKVITEKASRRIAEAAFTYAKRHGRKKVTAVHKANIMKLTDGLFLKSVREVAKHYPDIAYEEVIVDAFCMRVVQDPTKFDCIVTENLYGDILSDLCAGLVGGLGLAPGANIGENAAVFEAVHGTAPDIAGKGIANPTALLNSAILMLRHLGEDAIADSIEKALAKVLADGKVRTGDLGGKATTVEFTNAVIAALE